MKEIENDSQSKDNVNQLISYRLKKEVDNDTKHHKLKEQKNFITKFSHSFKSVNV